MADREYGFKANFSFGADSQTRTALNDVVSQIERLAEGIRKLQADTDGAKISIDTRGVERGASKVSRSFRRTGREMGDTQDETKRIRKEFRMLAAEMMTVNYGAVENVKAHEKGERQVKRYILQIDKLTKSLRGQSAEERQLAAQMKRKTQIEEKRMETIRAQREALLATSQQSAVEAGVMTFRGASSPIFGEIRKSAQIYANFDAKLREVSAKSGATEAESKELKKKAQALAISTQYSATQVAEAEVFLAQAGFKTGKLTAEGEKLNEITAALPEVLNLATSGTLELGEAADIASNVLSAFSLSAEETGRVSDALAKIANTTNTTVHNMGEAFAYAGAPAAAFGMTIEDVSSMLGMMGNMGIQATSGGTAIRAGAINLLNEKKAAKLKEIGVNVVDEAGEIRDIKDIMGDLWRAFGMDKDPKIVEDLKRAAAAGEDLDAALEGVPGKAKQLSIMSDVFGKPAISGWLALLTQYEGWMDSHRSIAKENEGYGGKVAKEMGAGLEGSLASLESAIEGFRLAFIEPLIPTVQLFTDLITNITRAFAGLPMPIRMAVSNLTLLVGLMAGAAAVIGGTTLLLSSFRTAVLTGKAAMVAFGGATAQAHSNLVFAEQSLNAYSFSGIKTFRPLFDSVRGYIVKAKEFSLVALTQIRVAIAAAHTSMMGLITPWRLMALAVLGFVYVLQSLTPEVSLFGGAIARLVPLLGFFRGLMEGIFGEEAVARYGESVKSFADLLTSPFRFVTDQVELFKKTVSDAFAGEAYKNAKNLGYLLGTVISQRVALAWDSTVGRIVSWLNHLVEFARKVGNLLIGALNCNPTEKIPLAWAGMADSISDLLTDLLFPVRYVGSLLAFSLGVHPVEIVRNAWEGAIALMGGSLGGFLTFAQNVGGWLVDALNHNPTEKIPEAWDGATEEMRGGLWGFLRTAREVAGSVFSALTSPLTAAATALVLSPLGVVLGMLQTQWTNFVNAMMAGSGALADAIVGMWLWVMSPVTTPIVAGFDVAQRRWESFSSSISESAPWLRKIGEGVGASFGAYLDYKRVEEERDRVVVANPEIAEDQLGGYDKSLEILRVRLAESEAALKDAVVDAVGKLPGAIGSAFAYLGQFMKDLAEHMNVLGLLAFGFSLSLQSLGSLTIPGGPLFFFLGQVGIGVLKLMPLATALGIVAGRFEDLQHALLFDLPDWVIGKGMDRALAGWSEGLDLDEMPIASAIIQFGELLKLAGSNLDAALTDLEDTLVKPILGFLVENPLVWAINSLIAWLGFGVQGAGPLGQMALIFQGIQDIATSAFIGNTFGALFGIVAVLIDTLVTLGFIAVGVVVSILSVPFAFLGAIDDTSKGLRQVVGEVVEKAGSGVDEAVRVITEAGPKIAEIAGGATTEILAQAEKLGPLLGRVPLVGPWLESNYGKLIAFLKNVNWKVVKTFFGNLGKRLWDMSLKPMLGLVEKFIPGMAGNWKNLATALFGYYANVFADLGGKMGVVLGYMLNPIAFIKKYRDTGGFQKSLKARLNLLDVALKKFFGKSPILSKIARASDTQLAQMTIRTAEGAMITVGRTVGSFAELYGTVMRIAPALETLIVLGGGILSVSLLAKTLNHEFWEMVRHLKVGSKELQEINPWIGRIITALDVTISIAGKVADAIIWIVQKTFWLFGVIAAGAGPAADLITKAILGVLWAVKFVVAGIIFLITSPVFAAIAGFFRLVSDGIRLLSWAGREIRKWWKSTFAEWKSHFLAGDWGWLGRRIGLLLLQGFLLVLPLFGGPLLGAIVIVGYHLTKLLWTHRDQIKETVVDGWTVAWDWAMERGTAFMDWYLEKWQWVRANTIDKLPPWMGGQKPEPPGTPVGALGQVVEAGTPGAVLGDDGLYRLSSQLDEVGDSASEASRAVSLFYSEPEEKKRDLGDIAAQILAVGFSLAVVLASLGGATAASVAGISLAPLLLLGATVAGIIYAIASAGEIDEDWFKNLITHPVATLKGWHDQVMSLWAEMASLVTAPLAPGLADQVGPVVHTVIEAVPVIFLAILGLSLVLKKNLAGVLIDIVRVVFTLIGGMGKLANTNVAFGATTKGMEALQTLQGGDNKRRATLIKERKAIAALRAEYQRYIDKQAKETIHRSRFGNAQEKAALAGLVEQKERGIGPFKWKYHRLNVDGMRKMRERAGRHFFEEAGGVGKLRSAKGVARKMRGVKFSDDQIKTFVTSQNLGPLAEVADLLEERKEIKKQVVHSADFGSATFKDVNGVNLGVVQAAKEGGGGATAMERDLEQSAIQMRKLREELFKAVATRRENAGTDSESAIARAQADDRIAAATRAIAREYGDLEKRYRDLKVPKVLESITPGKPEEYLDLLDARSTVAADYRSQGLSPEQIQQKKMSGVYEKDVARALKERAGYGYGDVMADTLYELEQAGADDKQKEALIAAARKSAMRFQNRSRLIDEGAIQLDALDRGLSEPIADIADTKDPERWLSTLHSMLTVGEGRGDLTRAQVMENTKLKADAAALLDRIRKTVDQGGSSETLKKNYLNDVIALYGRIGDYQLKQLMLLESVADQELQIASEVAKQRGGVGKFFEKLIPKRLKQVGKADDIRSRRREAAGGIAPFTEAEVAALEIAEADRDSATIREKYVTHPEDVYPYYDEVRKEDERDYVTWAGGKEQKEDFGALLTQVRAKSTQSGSSPESPGKEALGYRALLSQEYGGNWAVGDPNAQLPLLEGIRQEKMKQVVAEALRAVEAAGLSGDGAAASEFLREKLGEGVAKIKGDLETVAKRYRESLTAYATAVEPILGKEEVRSAAGEAEKGIRKIEKAAAGIEAAIVAGLPDADILAQSSGNETRKLIEKSLRDLEDGGGSFSMGIAAVYDQFSGSVMGLHNTIARMAIVYEEAADEISDLTLPDDGGWWEKAGEAITDFRRQLFGVKPKKKGKDVADNSRAIADQIFKAKRVFAAARGVDVSKPFGGDSMDFPLYAQARKGEDEGDALYLKAMGTGVQAASLYRRYQDAVGTPEGQKYARAINQYLIPILSTTGIREGELDKQLNNFKSRSRNPENQRVYAEIEKVLSSMYGLGGEGGEGAMKQLAVVLQGVKTKDGSLGADAIASSMRKFATRRVFADPTGNQTGAVAALADNLDRFLSGVEYKLNSEGRSKAAAELMADEALFSQLKHQMARVGEIASPEAATQADVARFLKNFVPTQRPAGGGTSYIKDIVGGLAQWNITGGGELAPEMARALEAFEGSSGAALDWKVGYEDNPTFQALARLIAGTSTTEEEAIRIREAFADIGLGDLIDDAHQSAQSLKALLNVDGKQRIGNMEAAVAGILDTFPTAAELRDSPAGEEINPIVTALESLEKYKKLENFGIRSWATFPELKVEDEVGQVVLGLMRNEEKAVELLRDMDREQKDIVEGIAIVAMNQAGLDTDAVSMLGIDPKLARKAKSVRREQSYRWLELAQVTEEPDYGKRGWKRKAGVAPKLNPKAIDELVTELEKRQGGGFIDRNAVEAFLRNPAAIAGASAGGLGSTQADAIREFLQSRVGAREAELKKEADKALKEFKDSGYDSGGVKASKAALKALDVRSFQEQKKVQPKESLKDTARNLERAMKTGGRGADPVTAAAIWLQGRTGDAVGKDLKKIAAQAKKAAAKAGKALKKEREAAKDRRAEMLNLAIRSLSDNKKGLDRVIEDLTSSGEARDKAIARALETYQMTGVLGGEILPSGQADAMFQKAYDKNAKKPSEAKAAWEALRKRFAVPDPESVALFAALEDILSTTGMTEGFKGLSDDLLNKKTGDGIDLFDEIATQKITAVKKISDQLAYLENKTNKTKEDLGQIEYLNEQRELGREHVFVTLDQPILAKKIAEAKRDRTLTEEAAQTKGRQETAKAMANYTQWMSRENAEEFREMLQSGETIDRAKFEEWAKEIAREQLKGAGMQPKEVEEIIRHLGKTLAKGSKGRKWSDSDNPMPNPLQTAVDALRNIQKLYGEAERSGDKQSLLFGIRSDSWAAKYKKLSHRQDYQDLVPILHQAGLLDLNEGKIDLTQKDSGIREFLTQTSEATKRILLNFVATGEYMRDSGVELEEILKALGMAEADIDRAKKDPIWKRLATNPEEYAQSPYTADSRYAAMLEAQLRRRQPDKDRERAIAEMEAPEPTTWAGELAKSIRWWLGLPGRTAKFLQDEVTREATRLKGAWVGFQSKVRGTIDWTKEWPLIGENYVFPFLDGAYNFARDLKNGAAKFAEETKEWGRLRALDLAAPFRGLAAAVVEGFGGAAEDFSADEDLGAHRWRSVAAALLEHTGFTQIGDWRRKRRAERKISVKGMDYSADLGDLSAQAGYSTGAEMVAELKEQFAGLAVESIELTKAVAQSGYRDPGEYFANEILPAILSDKPGAIAELIRKQTEKGNAHVAQAVVQSLGKTLDIGEEIMEEIANSEKLVVKLKKNFFDFVPFLGKRMKRALFALFGNPLSKVATADIPPSIRQLNNFFSFIPEVLKLQRLKLKRGAISKGFAIGIQGINWLSKSGLFPGMVEKMRNRFIDFTKNLNDETARSLEETRARLREIRNSGALHILAGLKNLFGTLFGAIGGLLKFAGTKVKERFQKWQQSRRSRVPEARPDPTEAERQSAIDKTFRRQQGLARRKERSAALKRQREAASAAQAAALVKEIQSRTRGRPPAAALKRQREAASAAQAAALAKEIQSRTRDRPPPVVPRIEPPPPVPGSGIGGGVTDRKPRWQREPESRKPPPSSIPRLERGENRTEDLVPGFPELNQRRAPTVSRRDQEPGALLRYQKPPAAKQASPPRPAPASVVSVAPSEPPKPGEKLHSNLGPELEGMGFVQVAVRRPIARPDDAISGIAAEAMAKAEELSQPREVEVIRPTTPEGKREKIEEIRRKELEELAELYKTAPEATPVLGALVDELKRMAAERFERSGLGENLESEWDAILEGVTRPDDPTQRAVLPGREDAKTLENVLATATTPEEVSRRVAKVSEILSLRADGDQAEPLKALQNSARVMKEKGDKIIEVIAGIAETSAAKMAEVEVQLQAEGLGTQEREELTAKLAEIRQLHDSVSSVGVTETDLDTYLEAIRQVKATKNDISGLMEVSREDAERLAESYENLKGLVEELTQSEAVLDLPTDLFGKGLTRDRTYLTMIGNAVLSAEEQIELAGEKLEQVSGAYADRVAELGGAVADSTAEIAAKLREELQGDISELIRFVDEVAGSAENVVGPYATFKEREYLKARREVESREIPYPGRAMTTIGDTEYEVAKERAAVKSPVEAAVALVARAKAELLKAFVRPLPVPAAVYEALQSYSGELEEILRLEQEIRDIRRQSQADKSEMEKDSKSPTAAILIQKDIEDLERRYRQKAEAFGAATAPNEREILESEMGDLRSLIQEKERRIAENFNDPAAAAILRQNIAELKQKESQKIEALNVSKGALEERMRGELPPETLAAAESVAAPLLRAAGVSEKKWQKSTFRIAETFKFLAKVAKKMGYLVQRGISEGSPGPSAAAREHWEHTSDAVQGEFDEMASGAAQAGFQVQSEFSDAAFAVGVAAGATAEDITEIARAVGENAAVAASEAVQAVEEVKDVSRETASQVAATSQVNSSWVARVWRRGTGFVRAAFMTIPLASMAAGQRAIQVARPAAIAIGNMFRRAFNFARSGGRGVFALGTAFSAVSFAASNVASSFAEMGIIDRHTADTIAKFAGLLTVVSAVFGVFGPLLTAVMGLLGALGAAVALVFNPIVLGVGAAVIAVLFLNAVLKRVFGIDLLKPFGDRIAGVTDNATGFMAEKFAWVREQFDRHLWRLTIPIRKLLNRFPQIGAAAEWVAAAWDVAISTIVSIFTGWWNKAVEIGSNLVNALNHNPTEKIPAAWEKAVEFIKGLLGKLLEKAVEIGWKVVSWAGTKVVEGLTWAWQGLREKVPEIFGGIVESVKTAIAGIPEFFLGLFDGEWAKALGDRISGAFASVKEAVGGWFGGLFGKKEELPEGFGQKIPAVIMGDVPEPAEAEKGWWGKAKGWLGGLMPKSEPEDLVAKYAGASDTELLAKVAAYENFDRLFNEMPQTPVESALVSEFHRRGIELTGQMRDEETGFDAIEAVKEGVPILAITGTQVNEMADLNSDLGVEIGADQYAAASGDISAWLESQNRKAIVTGHSLGGAIAQMVVADNAGRVAELETYNAAGVSKDVAAKFRESGAEVAVTHHVAENDIVSTGGEEFLAGAVLKNADYETPLAAHLGLITGGEAEMDIADLNSESYGVRYQDFSFTRGNEKAVRKAVHADWLGAAKGWVGGLFSNPFRRAPAPEPELTSGGLPAVLTAASETVVSAPEEKSGGFFGNLWGGIRDLWGGTAPGAKAGGAPAAPPAVFDYLDVLGDAQDAAAKAGDIDAYLAIDELLRAKAGYVTAQDIANLYEIGDAGTLVGKQIAKLNKKMERRRLYDILVGDRDPVKFLKEFAKTALPDWAYQAKWHVGEVRKEIEAMAKTGVRDLKLGVSPVDLYKPGVAEFGVQAKNLAIASGWLVRDSFGALMSGDMEKLSESWASFKGNVSYSASQISEAIKSISAATIALAIYTYLGLTPLQLGLIAAATAAVLLWRNFLGLRQVLWGLTKIAAGVGMAVAHSVEFAIKAIRPLGAMLKGLLYLDVSQIKAGFADLKGVASQTLEKLRKDFALIDGGILTVGRGLRAAANQIGWVLNRLKDGLGTAIVSALTSLRDLGAGTINLGRKFRRLGESVAVGVRDWATAVRANYPEFVAAFNELISTMTAKLVAGLKSAGIKAWAALFAGGFESSGEGVVALLGDVKGRIVGAVAGWSSAVRGNAPEFAAAVRQLGADGVEAFVRHFRDLERSLKAILDTIIATVKSFVGNFDAALKPAAALAELLARGFAPLKNLFRNPFGGGGGDVAKNAVAPFERAEKSARNAVVAFDRVGDSARGAGAALVAAGNAGETSLERVAAAIRTSLEKAGEVARAAAPAISAPIELAARQIPEGFRTAIASIPFGGIATGLREGLEKASEIAAPLAKGISRAIASGVGSLASAAFGALPDELRRAASEIGGDLSKLKETFGSASKNIAASLEAAFTKPIRELPSHIGKAVGEFRMLAEAVGATFDRIRESGKQAFDYIANRAEQDTRIVKGVVGAMGDKARADIETTKNAFGSANKKIRGFFGKTSESVRGDMGEMSAEAKVEGYEIQKNIAEGSPGTTRFIRQFWKVTGEFVGDIMKGMGRTADASGKAIAGSFESAATAARRAAKSYANPYAKGLSSPATQKLLNADHSVTTWKGFRSPQTQKMIEADHSVKPFRRPDPSRPATRRGKRKGVGVGDLESLSMASGGLLGNFSVAAAAPLFVFQDLMDAGRAFKAFLPKLAISIANAGGVMALLSGGFAAATAAVGAFLVAAAPFVAAAAAIVAVGYLLKRAYTNNVLGLKDAVTDLKNTIVFGFRDAIASITGPLDELAANILSLFGISSEEGGSFLKLIRIVGVGLLDLATLVVAAIAVPLVKAIRTVFQVWMFAFKVALLPIRILIGALNLVVTGIKLIVQTVKLLWEAFRFVGQAVADFLLVPFRLVYNLVAALFAKVRALMEPVGNFLTGVRDTLQDIPVIGYLFESRESAKSAGVGTDVPGYARGGLVSGAGSGTSDSILAALSDGEFVVNAAATRDNRGLLEAINGGELIDIPQVMAPSPDLPVMVAAPGGASVEDAVAARPVAVAPAEAPKQEVNITLNFNGDIVIPNATNGMEASHELLDAIGPHLRRKVMEILREMAEFRN